MIGGTLRIGSRAVALALIGWAGLFSDVRAQEGCLDEHDCRSSETEEFCALDQFTPQGVHCRWAIDEVEGYQCLTASGVCK